jgi:hypothetical protein
VSYYGIEVCRSFKGASPIYLRNDNYDKETKNNLEDFLIFSNLMSEKVSMENHLLNFSFEKYLNSFDLIIVHFNQVTVLLRAAGLICFAKCDINLPRIVTKFRVQNYCH